jgi:hypothetical protein
MEPRKTLYKKKSEKFSPEVRERVVRDASIQIKVAAAASA